MIIVTQERWAKTLYTGILEIPVQLYWKKKRSLQRFHYQKEVDEGHLARRKSCSSLSAD